MDELNEILDLDMKCLCVFVIDTYKSTDVNVKDEIPSSIKKILEDLEYDAISRGRIEVAFISSDWLSDEIRILQEPIPIFQAVLPPLKATTDDSSLPKALNLAMELIKTRKTWYKTVGNPYYRPWIFLISNGQGFLSCNITSISEKIKRDTINNKYSFLLTYTKDAEIRLLREFESDIPRTALASLNIMYYFKWLENSLSDVCSSVPVNMVDDYDGMDEFICGDSCSGEMVSGSSEIEFEAWDDLVIGDSWDSGTTNTELSDDSYWDSMDDNGNMCDWMYGKYKGSASGEVEPQLGLDDCTDSSNNTIPIYSYESLPLGYPIEERALLINEERIAMSQLELLRFEEDRCRDQIDKIRYGIKEQKQIEAHCMINREKMPSAEIHISDSRRLDSIYKMKDLLISRLAQLQNPTSIIQRLRGKSEINTIKELLMLLESFEIEKKGMFQQIEAFFQTKVYEADRQLSCGIKATRESVILLESYLSDHERELHDLIDRRRYIENELYKKRKESEMDEVYSSIFAPAEVKPGFHMLVQVYIHLYEETDKVKTLAQESDRKAERRDYIPLHCKLRKGDKVEVLLNIYGETLLMSDKKNVVWHGSFTKCSFDYFIPQDIDVDELSCVALLSVNGVPVGEMRFITRIVDSPRKLNPEIIAHKYSKVFISYSHQDESKVKFLHEGLELGDVPHFFDRSYLKPGDVFPQKIQDYINSADLFILCWSENASNSDYVRKERLQALERAFPQVRPEQAAKLRIYPMSIEPHAELPSDMKNYYHFGEI